jgi:hypothetical protein
MVLLCYCTPAEHILQPKSEKVRVSQVHRRNGDRTCEFFQKPQCRTVWCYNIVHLHPVAHCYFTFTFTFPLRLLCGLSMFWNTFQCSQHLSLLKSLKSLKPLHVSAQIGHPQVLILVSKQARKQRRTGTHEKQRDERAWLEGNSNLLRNKY